MQQQENLAEMIKTLNKSPEQKLVDVSDPTDTKTNEKIKDNSDEETQELNLINFYDWYEAYDSSIQNVARVKAVVANIDAKDSMIFKISKGKSGEEMELVSFYNPASRPILNLPPVYMKVFKNDTFEVLHQLNDEIFIKSYGVKTGLYVVYCANVDGKIVPYERIKVKKNATTVKLIGYPGIAKEIKGRLKETVDVEAIQLLYKQAIKVKDEFTTKDKTLDWFLKKQLEVVDINHLMKIDHVLMTVI
jgi:hypothetical protein